LLKLFIKFMLNDQKNYKLKKFIENGDYSMARKVILDMDPGIDDALAILFACRSPELEILGISVVSGNVHASKGVVNALRTLEVVGRQDIPVYMGQTKPLLRKHESAEEFHGSDGLGDAGLPMPSGKPRPERGVKFIVDTVMNSEPGEVTLISTGPLTDIASAILLEPEIVKRVDRLIMMGGAYNVTQYGFGNATPVSEYNIYADPEAAKVVFESGIPITAVGLDVTTDPSAVLTREHYEELSKLDSKTARFATAITKRLIERYGIIQLHDPMAVCYAVDESLFKTSPYKVVVVTGDGVTRGQTIADRRMWIPEAERKPNADIVCWVDGPRFIKLFMDRIK